MRRFLALFTILMLCGVMASAQTRVVSGKVIDKDGVSVPFATIKIKDTKGGTQADGGGAYSIKVKEGDILVISAANFKTAEIKIGTQEYLSTALEKTGNLTEVVVTTAFNRKTTSRSATSNVQVVNGEQLNTVRATNVNNALAGKAAGIQIRSQSAAALGKTTQIRLRGEGGLGGGVGPIYVVDGTFLPNSNDINPDDIEDISILNGPQAAALFGAVGQNGAVVVTLKKARKSNRMGIEINTGVNFDEVYVLPQYQNSYAGGISQDMTQFHYVEGQHPVEWKALDGKYYHDYYDDGSWGPRIAGQEYIPWYAWYGGHERSYKTATLTAQPNNIRNFYNTGVTTNTNIAFSKATDNTSIRVSYSNINVTGLLPNSSLKKNTFSTVMNFDLSTKLSLSANINYYSTTVVGMVEDGYSNQASGSFNQWFHRDLDIDIERELKGLRAADGVYASWNLDDPNSYNTDRASRELWGGKYWMNHFTFFDLTSVTSRNDRLFGNVGLTYKFNNDLQWKATYRKQQNTTFNETKFSSQIYNSTWDPNVFGVDGRWGGYYGTSNSFSNVENFESQLIYNKKIKDFGINAFAGIDIRSQISKAVGANTNPDAATSRGFKVDDLYTIGNSAIEPTVTNTRVADKSRAVYGTVDLSYKNYLFFNATIRKDFFSSNPPSKVGITSKSIGAGFVFSDLIKKDIPFLSYGKVRVSWGEAPFAVPVYGYPGFLYGVGAVPWDGNGLSTTPDQIVDPNITGAVKLMADIGVDLRFLNNRMGLSFTYYDGSEKNLPFTVPIATSSGFSSLLTNVGLINKKGIEISAMFKPIMTRNFKWEVTVNYGRIIDNRVMKITDSVAIFPLDPGGNSPVTLVHIADKWVNGKQTQVAQTWGQLYGGGMKRINGVPVLDADGFFERDASVRFGSVLPNYTGGVQNRFDVFTNFTFSFNIDFQVGGKFFSLSDNYGSYSGLLQKTATLNDRGIPQRDPVSQGGGVKVEGVDETGKPVTFYVESRDYWQQFSTKDIRDPFIHDLSFVKLREVALAYKIPLANTKLGRSIQGATFSILLRNPWLIYTKNRDFDPSEISDISGESGNLPGTRGVGVNLKVSF